MASDNNITINLELSEQAREALSEFVLRIEQAIAALDSIQPPALSRSIVEE